MLLCLGRNPWAQTEWSHLTQDRKIKRQENATWKDVGWQLIPKKRLAARANVVWEIVLLMIRDRNLPSKTVAAPHFIQRVLF